MSAVRTLICAVLLITGVLVSLQLIFDAFYMDNGNAEAIWNYLNWLMAVAMILALVASIRRVSLAGHTDVPAKIELLFVIFVSLLFYHTWANYTQGMSVTSDAWMVIDALLAVTFIAVGLRLLKVPASSEGE